MKNEEQLVCKVMKHFEGMNKLEVLDMLHRIEALLFYAKSPLSNNQIKKIVSADIGDDILMDPFRFTILPSGNFCEFIGSNDWIEMYKEERNGLARYYPFYSYYFKTKYEPLKLLRLTKKNLMCSTKNTPHEQIVADFLKKHRIAKKDCVTGKLLLSTSESSVASV